MVKVIFIIIVVFGYPLATHENKISCKSTIYRILLVLEAGLRKIHFISSYYFHTKLIINVLYK